MCIWQWLCDTTAHHLVPENKAECKQGNQHINHAHLSLPVHLCVPHNEPLIVPVRCHWDQTLPLNYVKELSAGCT